MTFGIVFQEYEEGRHLYNKQNIKTMLRLLWIVTTMLVTSAYSSNLKSNLIKKRYAKRTTTLNEMIDKDLTLHMSQSFFQYMENTISLDHIHQRMVCQVKKKDSIFQVT